MATLIPEDGTGLATANSYITLAAANTYHDDQSQDATWTAATVPVKEKGLREATQFFEIEFKNRWIGIRKTENQKLAWPRRDIVDSDGFLISADSVPRQIQEAAAELALEAIVSTTGTNLMPTLSDTGTIKRLKQKVGTLEQDTEYLGGRSPIDFFRKAEGLLTGFIFPSNQIIRA